MRKKSKAKLKPQVLNFPDGFLWGAATASYQVEGGIENNDWTQAAREGKVPPASIACDSYNLYEKDFYFAKSLGHNAHRLSIEWARIEPEEGKFDYKEIEHYRKVLMSLTAHGLEPFVTLWHFTLPDWFAQRGGFLAPHAKTYFVRYCGYVVERLGELANYWITINEPMVYASNGYSKGQWPPFEKNIFDFINIANVLATSHNLVYEKIKNLRPSLQVGIAKNNICFESNKKILNRLASKFMNYFWNLHFLNKISRHQDFIGLNYYFYKKFGSKPRLPKSDMGWNIYPKGIYNVLLQLKKYHKPIYITENGLADAKDDKREKFIKDHLRWIYQAIQEGIDVRGYLYWSLLDNFEWAHGYGSKFGLIEVNPKTMGRKVRPSARKYAKICRENLIKF